MKKDIERVVYCFEATGKTSMSCNVSFIALVPKVRDPRKLEQYKSISLVGSMYNITFKIISNKLKLVLPLVIDLLQFAFLKGR